MELASAANLPKSMKELLAKESFDLPKPGDIVKGRILGSGRASVLLDLGSLGTGIVYPGEFYDNTSVQKSLKQGDEISGVLVELENDDGYREVSLRRAQLVSAWQDIREKMDKGEILSVPVININKGGLIVEVNSIQGFLPLSQLSAEHYPKVEGGDTSKIVQNLQKFKGQGFKVKIIDFNETERKLIVSERAIAEEVAKEELSKLKPGDVVEGEITEVTDFGAFIKLSDNLDGLIHSSEIDWKFVEDPREVIKPGEKVKAKIVDISGGRVSLSLKALKADPWLTIGEKYQAGTKVRGRVVKIKNTGAFVELEGGIIGLLPTSELNGQMPAEVVEQGQEYNMAVVSIEPAEHKLVLTLEK